MYTLFIENTRSISSTTDLYNYIDGISIEPVMPNIILDEINIPCPTGGTADFTLKAGLSNGGKNYWLWMSVSGNYPGIPLNGLTVPLNMDVVFLFGVMNPNFPGSSGFVGKLDFFGMAKPTMTLPPDPQQAFMGIPIYFAYVLTAPGPSLPISFVSTPVHVKYVP